MWEFDPNAKAEIDLATDRAAAICGGAYVERALEQALRYHLHYDPDQHDKVFRVSGFLGTFDAKIRTAYLSMMIGLEFFNDLLIIKDIRNRFAHQLDVKSFNDDFPREKVRNLSFLSIGAQFTKVLQGREATHRERFLWSCTEAKVLLGYVRGKRLLHDPIAPHLLCPLHS